MALGGLFSAVTVNDALVDLEEVIARLPQWQECGHNCANLRTSHTHVSI